MALPGNGQIVLSEAVLVRVIVIEGWNRALR